MKCDNLQRYSVDIDYVPNDDGEYMDASEVDEAIAELKQTIDELVGVKKSAEQILQNLLDCGLIKGWYFNGTFNVVLKADDPHLQIAELKQKLEDVNELIKESKELLKESQKMHLRCADNASKQICRLKRALYKACANWAMNARMVEIEAEPWGENHESRLWAGVYDKCLKKAEEYK